MLQHLRDTSFSLRNSRRLQALWIKAFRHLDQGLSDKLMSTSPSAQHNHQMI
jgi:hypothetical protein